MPAWLWLIDAIAVVLVLFLITVISMAGRRRLIARGGPTFELSVTCTADSEASGWMLGVGRYSSDHLELFRVFSLSVRPKFRFERGEVEVRGRRRPSNDEARATHGSFVVVDVESGTPVVKMAMAPGALTGFLAWLESSPPGRNVNNVL